MTTKQAPVLHEPSCERAVRDLEALERIRSHSRLRGVLDLLRAEANDSRPFIALDAPRAASRVALLDDLIALLEPEGVEP